MLFAPGTSAQDRMQAEQEWLNSQQNSISPMVEMEYAEPIPLYNQRVPSFGRGFRRIYPMQRGLGQIGPYGMGMGGGFDPYMMQGMGGGFDPYMMQGMGGGFNPYQQMMGGGFNPYQQMMGGGFNPYQQTMGGGFNPYQQMMGGGFNPYQQMMGGGFNPYQQNMGQGFLDMAYRGSPMSPESLAARQQASQLMEQQRMGQEASARSRMLGGFAPSSPTQQAGEAANTPDYNNYKAVFKETVAKNPGSAELARLAGFNPMTETEFNQRAQMPQQYSLGYGTGALQPVGSAPSTVGSVPSTPTQPRQATGQSQFQRSRFAATGGNKLF